MALARRHPDAQGADPDADWWTTSDVAAYLGVVVSTVSGYRRRKQMLEPDDKFGRTWVWKPGRVMEWRPPTTEAHRRPQG